MPPTRRWRLGEPVSGDLAATLGSFSVERIGCVPAAPARGDGELAYDVGAPVEPGGVEWTFRSPGLGFTILTRAWSGLGLRRVYSLGWGLPNHDSDPLLLLQARVETAYDGVRLGVDLDAALRDLTRDRCWSVTRDRGRTALRFTARASGDRLC